MTWEDWKEAFSEWKKDELEWLLYTLDEIDDELAFECWQRIKPIYELIVGDKQ